MAFVLADGAFCNEPGACLDSWHAAPREDKSHRTGVVCKRAREHLRPLPGLDLDRGHAPGHTCTLAPLHLADRHAPFGGRGWFFGFALAPARGALGASFRNGSALSVLAGWPDLPQLVGHDGGVGVGQPA